MFLANCWFHAVSEGLVSVFSFQNQLVTVILVIVSNINYGAVFLSKCANFTLSSVFSLFANAEYTTFINLTLWV